MIRKTIISIALALFTFTTGVTAKEYKAVLFGIKSDGVTLNTGSIQRAIDYISENGGGTLTFYVGRYVTGSFQLKSNVKINLSGGAVLVFSPNTYDIQGAGGDNAMIYADGQENIAVFGGGTIEGSVAAINDNIEVQAQKGHIASAERYKPSLICFKNCKNLYVENLFLQNTSKDAVTLKKCSDVRLVDLSVFNRDIPADGIDIEGCSNIKVDNCYFDTKTAVKSNGTSSSLSFSNCRTVTGGKVEISK